jgi:hypothetical protein
MSNQEFYNLRGKLEGGLLGFALGMALMYGTEIQYYNKVITEVRPLSVDYIDVNKDNREDIVVKSQIETNIFLNSGTNFSRIENGVSK